MSAPFLEESMSVLARTPATLDAMLRGLPEEWTRFREKEDAWSPYSVVGHLIHADRTDWIPRMETILRYGEARPFPAFDREEMLRWPQQRPLAELLDEFAQVRSECLEQVGQRNLRPDDLERRGTHPAFGPVTLRQLLATWTAHDLGHTLQIVRTMALRYRDEVGPWAAYLSVMRS